MDLSGRRVTVMGLGRFGGGVGAVKFLVAQGCRVTVTDVAKAADLQDSLKEIEGLPVELVLGEHRERDFREADLVVASPAVPKTNPYLQAARDARIPITSEMNLFWERNRGRTVCITGSNGKSTTTSAIHAILKQAHCLPSGLTGRQSRTWLGGNIGHSLLPDVQQIEPADWVVLELSSFQLEDLEPLRPVPDVAVVTNFTPNHLDRHGTLDAYRTAKQNLLRWQRPDQIAVLNQDDPDVCRWPGEGRRTSFGLHDEGQEGVFAIGESRAILRWTGREEILPLSEWWSLPGRHNLQNALAAVSAAVAAGSDLGSVERGLRSFQSLPHRLQTVAEIGGRLFVNDSKATTPEAAALAVQAFDRPIILLAGGYNKQVDVTPLVTAAMDSRVRSVALYGATGPILGRHFALADPEGKVVRRVFTTLEEAFALAVEHSQPGDVVLLSPGCASYDQYRNYEERGAEFTRLAQGFRKARP